VWQHYIWQCSEATPRPFDVCCLPALTWTLSTPNMDVRHCSTQCNVTTRLWHNFWYPAVLNQSYRTTPALPHTRRHVPQPCFSRPSITTATYRLAVLLVYKFTDSSILLNYLCAASYLTWQVTWPVVTKVRSKSFRLVTKHRHYNGHHVPSAFTIMHIIFFSVECNIACFLCVFACVRRSGIILIP